MKTAIWLGLLYCASAGSVPSSLPQASAQGPGGVAVMNGGTVNVHVGPTAEEIERVIEAKGQERERQLRELARKVNALEKARTSDETELVPEEQVEKMLSASRDQRLANVEGANQLFRLVEHYKELQSGLRSQAALEGQIRRLLAEAQQTRDPAAADELLERAARLTQDCARTAKHQGAELDRQAASVTVHRAYLALDRKDRMRAAQLFQLAFRDRGGDIDPVAVGWLWDAGDTWADIGDGARAIEIYSEAYSQAKASLAREPGNTQWQRAVAYSDQMVGVTFLHEGRAEEARSRFEESTDILEKLPAADRSGGAQEALIQSHQRLAHAWRATENIPAAIQELEAALRIATAAASVKPDDPLRQRQVLIVAGDLASLQHAEQLDASLAIESMRRLLGDATRSAEAQPMFIDWKWNEAIALQNIAESEAEGDAEVQEYTQALQIYMELDAACSDIEAWKRFQLWKGDILSMHERLGHALVSQRQFDAGLAQLRLSLQIAQDMVGTDPLNASLQRILASVHAQIGKALASQGNPTGALNEYRTTEALLEQLISLDPKRAEWQEARWSTYRKMGEILSERKDFAGATNLYEESLKVAQEFADRFPDNREWQATLLESLKSTGKSLRDDNNPMEAIRMFRAAAELARKVARTKPNDTYWTCNVAWITGELAEILRRRGHYIRASWLYRDAITVEWRIAGYGLCAE